MIGKGKRGEIEEARGRTDLASVHHPTLLAAEPQTVCSQQYMHLLVLFQEIISLCVRLCVDVSVHAESVNSKPKVANELRRGGRRTIWRGDPRVRRVRLASACLSVGVSDYSAKCQHGGNNQRLWR